MKKCPSCGRTYTDPALNFCLQDGTVLEQEIVSTFGNEETVVIGQTPSTNPGGSPYGSSPNAAPPPTWAATPYSAQPRKKKSKAWIFILLALFAFGAIGVVGIFGFLVYLGMKVEQQEAANKAKSNSNTFRTGKGTPTPNSTSASGTLKDDFSKWKTGDLSFGKVKYEDDKLIVSTLKNDFYCVIPAYENFVTNDAITRVTVENTTGGASTIGYGLVVQASPIKALLRDYAFLIRTDGTPAYRIVSHSASIEKDLVKWTSSTAINKGDDENKLEVRDEGKKLSFYINDEFVTSIDDGYDDAKSIAGIYAGSAIPIAFSDLEIEKK